MKSLKEIGVLIFFFALLFSACRKDEEIFGTFPPDPPTPEIFVNGTIDGTVVDEVNQPLVDAIVTFGSQIQITDENGFFTFTDVDINEKGSLVKIEKEGYFYNSKFVGSKLNRVNYINVKLIQKNLVGSFGADSGGTVTTSDGASVQFAANSIKKETGEAYSGNVNVYATWLNPTASDLLSRMPGDLRAINASNDQQQLTTFGMIGVEMESDTGE